LKSIITFCAFAVLCARAGADTIVLKNGDRIQADSAQERNGRVEYTLGDNTMSIPRSIVVRIEKGPVYGRIQWPPQRRRRHMRKWQAREILYRG
jgi:hypothetical protein